LLIVCHGVLLAWTNNSSQNPIARLLYRSYASLMIGRYL
jgi:hypothetical protein